MIATRFDPAPAPPRAARPSSPRKPAPAPSQPRRQLRVVTRAERIAAARRARRARLLFAAALTTVALIIFGVVVAHVALAQGQFRLEQLEAESARRQSEFDRLRLEVAELESPVRIAAEAKNRLGMVAPPTITYLAPSDVAAQDAGVVTEFREPGSELTASAGWLTVKPHLTN